MKKYTIIINCLCAMLIPFTSCTDSLEEFPELQPAASVDLPAGTQVDADRLFGVWGAQLSTGHTASTYFEQRYEISFQDLDDSEAVVSHWYTDADTEMEDSIINMEYLYEINGSAIKMTPTPASSSKGAREIKGINLGDDRILLYTQLGGRTDTICTINRTGDPVPSITSVDRTLPLAGQKVTIKGRNLQFVDALYLPLENGDELMVPEIFTGSKEITFVMPEGDFAPGAIRAQSSSAHVSCYSPRYMF